MYDPISLQNGLLCFPIFQNYTRLHSVVPAAWHMPVIRLTHVTCVTDMQPKSQLAPLACLVLRLGVRIMMYAMSPVSVQQFANDWVV